MTTIAWDGKTLAADRQGDAGGLKFAVCKLRTMADGSLIGVAGPLSNGLELIKWIEEGEAPDKLPAFQRTDDWAGLLRIMLDGRILRYERGPIPFEVLEPFYSIGSGRDFAMAAMAMGKSAAEAVELAARFDSGTGLGVDCVQF